MFRGTNGRFAVMWAVALTIGIEGLDVRHLHVGTINYVFHDHVFTVVEATRGKSHDVNVGTVAVFLVILRCFDNCDVHDCFKPIIIFCFDAVQFDIATNLNT